MIKAVLLVAIVAIAAVSLRPATGARHLALRRISLLGFALLAVLSIIYPEAWNEIARSLGVGRGTDLLLYGLIVTFLAYVVTTYRRHRDLEGLVTALARRIAIDEATSVLTASPTGHGSESSTGRTVTGTPHPTDDDCTIGKPTD